MSLRYCLLPTLLCLMVTGAAQGNQYCHGICGNKSTHTLCKFQRPGPGQMCVGYIRSRLTPSEKARIVARLNQRRNQAAMGHRMGLPPATNMMKLRWVEELAMSAQRWADQCMPPATPDQRDECRDLYMASAGQAVGSIVGDAPGLRVEALIDSWYMQSLVYRGNVTSYEPAPYDKSFYGDFTQMMWAKSYMVGCGRSRFMTVQGSRHSGVVRLVCNFVPRGNLRARPVWMPGAPCARCPADTECYADTSALCHYPDTKKDLFAAVERAQHKYAVQAPHVKVRRERRERAIDELPATPAPPSPVSLPPLLAKLVHYLPFLAYEARNGACRLGRESVLWLPRLQTIFLVAADTKKDLFAAVERAQHKYAVQAPHVKVRRERRERAIDKLHTTPAPPSPVSLPPLLAKLVHYLPFLAYEARSGARGGGATALLPVACAAILCLLE